MQVKFIEVTNGPRNWGKFAVCEFTEEEWWERSAVEPSVPLVPSRGWTRDHYLVLDLQTGEGAMFKHGGYAKHDLNKHAIWVCPMFEPFLVWLYKQPFIRLEELPAHVDLPDAEFMMSGHRRPGPKDRAIEPNVRASQQERKNEG